MVRLQTLGACRLWNGDTDLSAVTRQPKRLLLLAYLATAPQGRARDALQALFWPELDASAARNALSQALHFLRRHLGEGVLRAPGPGEVAVDDARLCCD
ncbi:MAG TPA: hypothetical protein VJT67_05360, partial [Longimicrobiaceae bacterium]|nr:hypothetical protein [Longimicrobiaceae bacterium]